MKQQLFSIKVILILTSLVTLIGCQKDDDIFQVSETKFLVDKIYNYNNDLIAEYFYDNENRLIKKYVTEHLGNNYQQEWASYSDEFEYQNGRVSKIIHKDISYNMFNYETNIFYNSIGTITKTEIYKNGQLISNNSNYRYKNGNLTGTIKYNLATIVYKDSIIYNKSGNVIKYLYERPETDLIGNPLPQTKITTIQEFSYDNHLRPNFNLDYLFIYEPLPFNELADLQRHLSTNNMTYFIDGTKWIYSYNEQGLPSKIEVKWKDIETTLPMMLRITYKEIN
ncbi:hypothetical protein [Flavobacterium nackdongense]|uniref:DUF4595 domain-containing protein n=1 Tax=Flavobacterium nackdongense TaxID=2547394 RepID=A0A4P6YCT9_9FLAO|nr:hypothetical protein [Flavobacterium nackdongense]QBN18153.1 hypothetical protein E1750_04820 [Flavobacterium nackdongense]